MKEAVDVDDIICNKCGKSCKIDIGYGHHNIEAIEVKHTFGYGSDLDMTSYELHLCEECFVEFTKSCKIEPEIRGF